MPNSEKSRAKAPDVERKNAQDDHEGSPHDPSEFLPDTGETADDDAAGLSVAERAHAIWEREGRPDGQHERHWRMAEEERDQTTKPSLRPEAAGGPGEPIPMSGTTRQPAVARPEGPGAASGDPTE
ncbi:DUF2934 domain-containing protein [Frigidibacter sp. MR17.24]|uniref:DUF2934 domain-containing protein n=1 Tax=Frigidibacter sp. MR17.24 TaxID=3127345 RepID=UPI003013195F